MPTLQEKLAARSQRFQTTPTFSLGNKLAERTGLQNIKNPSLAQKLKKRNERLSTGGNEEDQGFFRKVLDILNTGGYAVGGLISGKGISKGIEEKIFPSKALGIENPLLAFGTDVLLDPTTYLGLGGLTKVGKAAQLGVKGAKLLPTLEKQALVGQRALVTFAGKPLVRGAGALGKLGKAGMYLREQAPGISEVVQKLGKTFSPGFRPAGVAPEAFEAFRKAQIGGRSLQQIGQEKAIRKGVEMTLALRKANVGEEGKRLILESLERGRPLSEALQPFAKQAKEVFDEGTRIRSKYGKALLSQSDLEYVPHLARPRDILAAKREADYFSTGSRIFSTSSAADIERTLEGSIVEINTRAGRPIFSEDLPQLMAASGSRQAKLEASTYFLNGVKEAGVAIESAPKGWVKSTAPELEGLAFHPELAKQIDAVHKAFSSVDEVNAFVKGYDQVLNGWKGLATFVNLPFHTRNAVSNLWQNYLAGIKPWSSSYLKAADLIRRNKNLAGRDKEILDAFTRFGLSGIGWIGADIEKTIQREAGRIGWRKYTPFALGRKMGNLIEDNAKLAHFIDKVKQGASYEQAAVSVRKYLFDYKDITPFERNIMKRIFPFYTWTRKNLPLQLQSLFQEPGKFAQLGKGIAQIERATGGDTVHLNPRVIPDFLRQGVPIQLGEGAGGTLDFLNLSGLIPASDISKLANTKELVVDSLTPIGKTLIELAINRDLYLDKPILEFKGQKGTVFGQAVPKVMDYLASKIRPITELEKIVDASRSIPGRFINIAAGGKIYRYKKESLAAAANFKRNLEVGRLNSTIKAFEKKGNKEEVARLKKMKRELQNLKF